MDPTGRRCKDEIIHVKYLLDETPVKEKEMGAGDGRAFRLSCKSDTCERREGTKNWVESFRQQCSS